MADDLNNSCEYLLAISAHWNIYKPTSNSGLFGKISFRSSMYGSTSLQRAEFVSFNSFSEAQKIQTETREC